MRNRCGQTVAQAGLAVDTPKQHRAEVRGHRPAIEVGPDGTAIDGMKSQLLVVTFGHGRTSALISCILSAPITRTNPRVQARSALPPCKIGAKALLS